MSDPIRDLVLSASKITTEADAELAVDLWNELAVTKKRLREAEEIVRGALVEFLEAHGEAEIGPDRKLVLAQSKRVTCRDIERTADALLDATGGDLVEFCRHLSAQPFKHGAAREALGDRWDDCFETAIRKTPKEKQIQVLDARYAKA